MAEKKKSAQKKKKPAKSATPETTASTQAQPEAAPDAGFPIVGIGASAGGLKAFEAFFSGMPADSATGMAFVLVQHLAPDHKSMLVDLISRYTRMRVLEVEDGMRIEPDCVYIIPPNRDMVLIGGTLQLLEPCAPRGQRLPIDFFFRSLADELNDRAIGIVLSGTGSDGMLGVRAIKGAGGMVMVQNPESTEYDGMPRSALGTGLVDFELPPAEMAVKLIAYATHAFGKVSGRVFKAQKKDEDALKKIFFLLRNQTGHDFSQYKHNTVSRRIERRMAVQQIDSLTGYVFFLQQSSAEVQALFHDLLIGVTSFFRDPGAFEALEKHAIPQLFVRKPSGSTIRVWVPGCSTGEEAYSIAILLHEAMQQYEKSYTVQLFATDIDTRAIDAARSGRYPASSAADLSPERLANFFIIEPDGATFRIQKILRDMLIFSEHDLIKDPPFSRIDLISCRNLLIYMTAGLQKKIFSLLHYALNPGGMLFLGVSESVGDFMERFHLMDRAARLYQRKESDFGAALTEPTMRLPSRQAEEVFTHRSPKAEGTAATELRELAEQALLLHCCPAGALVNQRGDILYLHGRTGFYLEPAPGEAGLNILKMAREGLRRDLSASLHKAVTHKITVLQSGVRVKTNGDFTMVNLSVRPLVKEDSLLVKRELFLVVFDESREDAQHAAGAYAPEGAADSGSDVEKTIATLHRELHDKEEYLQSTIEEMETANEELQSTNEELQSVNEELQSTNEELETSKEEMQSLNEELSTVNAELQQRVTDLSRVNNDMNNLMAATGIGTIFVDHQLCIQRFTPAVTRLINLIPTDVGRPVGHIVSNLIGYDCFVEDVQAVLETLEHREIEVQTVDGMWYLLYIRPYRTIENMIEGAVITFTDITETIRAREVRVKSEDLIRLATVVADARDAMLVYDKKGRILSWNPAAVRMYGWTEAEALTMNISGLVPEHEKQQAADLALRLSRGEVIEPCRAQRFHKDGRIVAICFTATALVHQDGEVYAVATTEWTAEE